MKITELKKGIPILIPEEFIEEQRKKQNSWGGPIKWDPRKAQEEFEKILASQK